MRDLTERETWFFFSGLLWGLTIPFGSLLLGYFVVPENAWAFRLGDLVFFGLFTILFAALGGYGWAKATDRWVDTIEVTIDDDVDDGRES